MIIFGTRGVTSTSGKGNFLCPACGAERPYAAKRMRRFFTLYFIPLIPLDVIQEWVECGRCGGTYKSEVLRQNPQAHRDAVQARQNAVRAAVMVAARRLLAVAAGPAPGPELREAARRAHETLFGEDWPEDELSAELGRAAGPAALEPFGRIAGDLNTAGKEAMLTEAVRVATLGGALDPAVAVTLGRAAEALGVSEAHWRGIAGTPAAQA
jgi:hypothetical protein